MTREDALPERLDGFGYALHTESYQAFFPARGSVASAARILLRVHRKPWRLLCARCLALKYVRQRHTRYTGMIFGGALSAKLRARGRRKDPARAVDRMRDELERDIVREKG